MNNVWSEYPDSEIITITCSDTCPDSLSRFTHPGKKKQNTNIWTYLLIVFEFNVEPTGFDHPSVVCSWIIQCADGKSPSEDWGWMFNAVTLKSFCFFTLLVFVVVRSLCLWLQALKPATVSFPPSSSVCVCVCVACRSWKADRGAPQTGFCCVQWWQQMWAECGQAPASLTDLSLSLS